MVLVKKINDVEFYYEQLPDESYKVIAYSVAQQRSAILAYENDIDGVFRCINVFSKGFDLNGFKLN